MIIARKEKDGLVDVSIQKIEIQLVYMLEFCGSHIEHVVHEGIVKKHEQAGAEGGRFGVGVITANSAENRSR